MMNRLFRFLFFLIGLWILTTGADVSCQFGQSCMLPCSFTAEDDTVIHWIQLTPNTARVHSYYENKNQLGQQDPKFKGRTSLFLEEISRGNASLKVTGVMVQDEGTYLCYSNSIIKKEEDGEISVNMTVYAPLQKINITQTENLIICSSDEIYPEPHLSWSISPPSSRTFQKTTTVQKTEELLYNISSSLTLSDSEEDLDHICTISTPSNERRASWRRRPSVTIISGEATISCSALDSSLKGLSLVWRFNQREIIVTKNEDDEHRVSEEWKQHVKDVSESGRLTLQHLSADHEGTYTCEVSNDGDTRMAQISLRLPEGKVVSYIVCIAVVVTVMAVLIGVKVCYIKTKIEARRGQIPSNTESVPNIIYEETNNGEEHENSTPMNYGTIGNNTQKQHCKAAASSVSPSAEPTQHY